MATAGKTRLVIVESPAKATKIASFLGTGYVVESSRGHVADLPTGAAEVPAKYKGEKWARTGVNVDNDFEPLYVVQADKKGTIRDLKAKLATADELLLATDEDREGEAIAWHLLQQLKPKVPVRRMVFHEITPQAIAEAVNATRSGRPAATWDQRARAIAPSCGLAKPITAAKPHAPARGTSGVAALPPCGCTTARSSSRARSRPRPLSWTPCGRWPPWCGQGTA